MKKALTILTAMLIFCGCSDFSKSDTDSAAEVSRDIFAMDTYMNLKAYGSNAQTALDRSSEKIAELENMLSVTNENSDIWTINHADGVKTAVSEDTLRILDLASVFCDKTYGALDITIYPVLTEWGFTTGDYKIPDADTLNSLLENVDYRQIKALDGYVEIPEGFQLDLGAVAKGYTGDCVMEIMKENGVESAVISLGGNVHTLGKKPDGSLWNIAVVDPFSPSETMCILSLSDKAVITSGSYERFFVGDDGKSYCHIIDPSDGFPADNGLVSVTIIGESGIMCDALSTALFIMGKDKAIEYWRQNNDFEMILVTENAEILYSEGLEECIKNAGEIQMEIIRT